MVPHDALVTLPWWDVSRRLLPLQKVESVLQQSTRVCVCVVRVNWATVAHKKHGTCNDLCLVHTV